MNDLRMFYGLIRTDLQTALEKAAGFLSKYTKKTIVIIACSKPMLPFQPNLDGIEVKILSPFSIKELDMLETVKQIPANTTVKLPEQPQQNSQHVQLNLPSNGIQSMNSTVLPNQVQTQMNMANMSMPQIPTTMNQNSMMTGQAMNQTSGMIGQQPTIVNQLANQMKMQQINQQKLQQQMNNQLNTQMNAQLNTQMNSQMNNQLNTQMNNQYLQMNQFNQPFLADLQSNQFLETQKQQHQQHMARNNAIAGTPMSSLMNTNNMNLTGLGINLMMNQQSPFASPNLTQQRGPQIVWNGHFSWVMNPQGMQVEVQCGVTAITVTTTQNLTLEDHAPSIWPSKISLVQKVSLPEDIFQKLISIKGTPCVQFVPTQQNNSASTYSSLASTLTMQQTGVAVKFNQNQGMIIVAHQSKIYGLLFLKNPNIDSITAKLSDLQNQRAITSLTPQQLMQLQQLQQLQMQQGRT